jgi:ribonucleoside-diphosphate reductase beta chain
MNDPNEAKEVNEAKDPNKDPNEAKDQEPALIYGRPSLHPIQHSDVYEFYTKHLASFWTPHEIDLSKDKLDFTTLSREERMFILRILSFFAGSDVVVLDNLVTRFYTEIKMPEARQFYAVQILIEAIHTEVYERLLITLVDQSDGAIDDLLNAKEKIPAVAHKTEWAQKWITGTEPLAQRLLAFIIVEGLFFSGSFCSIFWLRHRGILNGLMAANDFISRDETLHTNFGVHLYNKYIVNKLTTERAHDMFREAVHIECKFIQDALPTGLDGMSAPLMTQYIQHVADHWLSRLYYPPLYNVGNPFGFMISMSCEDRTNFFERRNTTYTKTNVKHSFKLLDKF